MPAGGAGHAEAEAVYDKASDGWEQDVLHGGEQELHAHAPGRGGRAPEGGRGPIRPSRRGRVQGGVARKTLETASSWALSLLGVAWKVLETASSWSKAQGTLARGLGLEEMVVVMPQEHLAKNVMQDTHREDHRRTPQEVIARTKKQVGIPKGTQRARKLPLGEADPEVLPQATTGQEGFSPSRGGGPLRGEGSPESQLQGAARDEGMPQVCLRSRRKRGRPVSHTPGQETYHTDRGGTEDCGHPSGGGAGK